MGLSSTDFEPWLTRWGLQPDGAPTVTEVSRSLLAPVRKDGEPAMLKIATEPEERRGADLMTWWAGEGAAPVFAHEGPALLMLRAEGERSLVRMAAGGEDEEASEIICAAVAALHRPRPAPPPASLRRLRPWFQALEAAASQGGRLGEAWRIAAELFAEPRDVAVLHGDVHHGNILDFGARGFLAIDPKGLLGERGYDYANLFRNPDESLVPGRRVATDPGRLARRLEIVARLAGLDRARLLRWIIAHAGLSSAWLAEVGGDSSLNLEIIDIALALLES